MSVLTQRSRRAAPASRPTAEQVTDVNVVECSHDAGTLSPGDSITVSFTLENPIDEAVEVEVNLFVFDSNDNRVNTEDVGTFTMPSRNIAPTVSSTYSFSAPTSPGTYRIVVQAVNERLA